MLLRRVMQHVKDQNWTAVILDFFIVVAGVYIGIFLGNIQDERNFESDTRRALSAVEDELRSDVDQLDQVITTQEELVASQRRVIEMLRENDPDMMELGRLLIFITQSNATFFPNRAAYQAMKSNGHLSALPDGELRLQISNLFERYLVRQYLNAELYDEVGFDFMRDIRDVYWDSFANRPIGQRDVAFAIMRNGVRTLLDQSIFYLTLSRDTVRPEYARTLSMIDAYQG